MQNSQYFKVYEIPQSQYLHTINGVLSNRVLHGLISVFCVETLFSDTHTNLLNWYFNIPAINNFTDCHYVIFPFKSIQYRYSK
jgi:hypothetical protein